ncbi:alpha/beta hydrolase [Fretibacter rubidus]|uniref:alpha/beta hydrolase n=1 Tax=Fretibacter rubidus TaxID=570162 RepID=UPI00352A0E68
MIRALRRIIFAVVALYSLALLALYFGQRAVLYIPPDIYLTPNGVELESAVEITVSPESNDIMGWWIAPKSETAPVVIYFHGNGSAVFSASEIYRSFEQQGYGVFALAYPGYPGRRGKPTQDSLTQAAIDGYDYVRAYGINADRIVYYGTSLGAGVAAQLAGERRPAIIIMEAPFTSAADMAQLRFPIFPAGALTKDKFQTTKALAGTNTPIIWIHGTNDQVIPFQIGQNLFDGYDGPKTAYKIEGGKHNNLWYKGGDAVILEVLAALQNDL